MSFLSPGHLYKNSTVKGSLREHLKCLLGAPEEQVNIRKIRYSCVSIEVKSSGSSSSSISKNQAHHVSAASSALFIYIYACILISWSRPGRDGGAFVYIYYIAAGSARGQVSFGCELECVYICIIALLVGAAAAAVGKGTLPSSQRDVWLGGSEGASQQ
uniref:Uncharacterized protein n=1 Tax=Trichogramma kaykai TaxID=54128 RepID=A0ABD2XI28_9HYME